MVIVVVGLVVVGLSDTLFTKETSTKSASAHLTGDIIIVVAQVRIACTLPSLLYLLQEHAF